MGMRLFWFGLALASLGLVAGIADWTWDDTTFLDNYVYADDGFDPTQYTVVRYDNHTNIGCETYILNFTSGRWMDGNYSTQPVWWHYLAVNLPLDGNLLNTTGAGIFIDGGGNGGPPSEDDDFIIAMCLLTKRTGTVSGVLKQIPNQDIAFYDDPEFPEDRGEDDLIAYTWSEFVLLHNDVEDYVEADYERLLQFPMARGSVRALDVMNAFSKVILPETDLQGFIVAGGSKRGWASWLVAALDKRVEIVVPLVISILNMTQNMHHSYENLGNWTFAFFDYWEKGVTTYLDDPRTQLFLDEIDPFSYRQRMTMMKVVSCATGDEFFLVDDSYDFFSDLEDPKYMYMMEKAEHSLTGSYRRILDNMENIWRGHYSGTTQFPHLTWTMSANETWGRIDVNTDVPPVNFTLWVADTDSNERRDFRIIALDGLQIVRWNDTYDGAEWYSEDGFTNAFSVAVPNSEDKPYRAFFLNMFFPGGIEFTTEVNVIPWTRPFPPCEGADCRGFLI